MGNFIDNSQIVRSNSNLSGPKLNQELLHKEPSTDDQNVLKKEQEVLEIRLEKLKNNPDVEFKRYNPNKEITNSDLPQSTYDLYQAQIDDKRVSYEMMLNVVARRFHKCLKAESQARPALAGELGPGELVHQVCRRERLTFYNFLMEHTSMAKSKQSGMPPPETRIKTSEEYIKEMINREYAVYFQAPPDLMDIYSESVIPFQNPINKRFKVGLI